MLEVETIKRVPIINFSRAKVPYITYVDVSGKTGLRTLGARQQRRKDIRENNKRTGQSFKGGYRVTKPEYYRVMSSEGKKLVDSGKHTIWDLPRKYWQVHVREFD